METQTNIHQLEMVMLVFKIRKIRLLSSAPKKVLKSCEQIRLFDIVEEKLFSISQYTWEQQLFYIDLFYQTSRIWEAYSVDKSGKIRFQFQKKSCVENQIIKNFNNFVRLFQNPIQLGKYDDLKILQFVKNNLIANIKTLSHIYEQKITNDQIERFFEQVNIIKVDVNDYQFRYFAFCSPNSTRIYVQFIVHRFHLSAVLVESFYYRLIQNCDPLVILSEGKKRLYINKNLYEPGDYYNKIVNKLEIRYPSPFRMQMLDMKAF